MPADQTLLPTLRDHLSADLHIGEPDVHGPLAVFPIFGPEPRLPYVSFADGRAAGAGVKELESGAAVNDLLILNPTERAILLYEGEEVLGAQQNRTFDTSVLVAAGSQLRVPVSCVEAGRWDGSRHGEVFEASPQTAYPALRKLKNEAARASMALGGEARAVQSAVWNEVAEKADRMTVHSGTGAMHDIFEDRRDRLGEFQAAMTLHDGQLGAIAAVGGRVAVLDHVSRSDVFATLHAPLVQGYALDALEAGDGGAPSVDEVNAFLQQVLDARTSEGDGIGLGRDVRFTAGRVGGSGLVASGELIQVTAFADDGNAPDAGPSIRSGRIRRPSRRR